MPKTGTRGKREREVKRGRETEGLGKAEKVHKDKSNKVCVWGGARLVPVVSPFGPLMCGVTALLTEG